ncbi:hypothetical protein F5Y09DRAFT_105128 [Xylaria sp. FL1042]|nr:hypothetical protein F5Y09DRAFT_105128 [Xylaria sp. FL1042]
MVDFLDNVLPDECVCAIWALLQPQDLRAVMRVSSAWAASAAPILYRNIDIGTVKSLQRLLCTVQHRPGWAASTRRLCLRQTSIDLDAENNTQSLAGPAASLLQRLPALQELRIEGSWSGDLVHLLGHSPALTSFCYDRWCDVTGNPSLQDCDELGRGLHYLHRTLEHLDLRVRLYSTCAEEVDSLEIIPVRGHLHSLPRFSNLRTLRVPIAMLLGWTPQEAPEIEQLLPRSLRNLSLSEDLAMQCTYQWPEEVLVDKLETFFAAMARKEHTLELVKIYPEKAWGGWEDATKERVQEMATRAGVRCIVA